MGKELEWRTKVTKVLSAMDAQAQKQTELLEHIVRMLEALGCERLGLPGDEDDVS